MPTTPQKRVTKRRGETRQRLLDAALEVFADYGFGRATVEQVCERGGYTRGAFYSNFATLDEMFFAMWEQRSTAMLNDLRSAVETARGATEGLSGADEVAAVAERVLAVVPVDDQWYRINAEFTAHALRHPSLKRALAAREAAILTTIIPIVESALGEVGRRIVGDPDALGRALVAIHDGTSIQCLTEDHSATASDGRRELFTRVLLSYSELDTDNTEKEETP